MDNLKQRISMKISITSCKYGLLAFSAKLYFLSLMSMLKETRYLQKGLFRFNTQLNRFVKEVCFLRLIRQSIFSCVPIVMSLMVA